MWEIRKNITNSESQFLTNLGKYFRISILQKTNQAKRYQNITAILPDNFDFQFWH
jgi:hypothetical protein